MDFNKAKSLLQDPRTILLDVRTPGEFCEDHLEHAVLIPTPKPPLSEPERQQLSCDLWRLFGDKNKETPVVIYCKLGKRARIAKDILASMGFHNVATFGIDYLPK